MPRRAKTLDTLTLALELLRRIPRGRWVTAPVLHQQLKEAGLARNLRTIQRILEMLTARYDIERDDRSRPYGYRWKERAQPFALPCLSQQESLLLALAERHLKNLLPASLTKSLGGFFDQARVNIGPQSTLKREREWLSKVRVVSETQPLLPPTVSPVVFEQVSNALYENRWLEVDYRNLAGKRIQAEVMPLGLAQQGPRLYLVCRFDGYENERSLALHRILTAHVLPGVFERPPEFSLKKYDEDGRFGFGEGQRIPITFWIDKSAGQHLLETPLSEDQQVTEKEDSYHITATVVDSEWFWHWLRGFGEAVSICPEVP